MTMLSDLANLSGGATTGGAFKFKRVGDTVKGRITRSSLVETTDRKTGKTKTSLVIDLEVMGARGGIVDKVTDDDGIDQIKVSDFKAGDTCTVWMNPGFGIGAIRDALENAEVSELKDGGTLTVKLTEKRDTGKESPAHVYEAKYESPAGGTSIDDLDSF